MATPPFVSDVYDMVRSIPPGRVSTYGFIAAYLGLGSARMVGHALKLNMQGDVPAHRVVNRLGQLSGRLQFGDPDLMAALLEQEGVVVVNNTVVDFDRLLWLPSIHLP
jgi:methylated-DNA-protein-cysteine methyltransferase-like protein